MAKTNTIDDGLIEVYIPRSGPGEEEQLVIGINGENTVIPKGQRVRVKPWVAEEIFRSQEAKDTMYSRKEEKIREAAAGKQQ
ncbi:MAG: hypothetical protein IK149_01740 [Oscillospiraceae bacterium]|nr:hypothetical protein [Oscillospiraceae bacterium]